jgi:hypothetical protein
LKDDLGARPRGGAVLLQAPAIDRLDVEAPVAADPERRQLPELQLAVNRRRMNPEVVGQFPHGHDLAVVWIHFTDLPDFLIRKRALLPRVRAVDFHASVASEVDVEDRAQFTPVRRGDARLFARLDRPGAFAERVIRRFARVSGSRCSFQRAESASRAGLAR